MILPCWFLQSNTVTGTGSVVTPPSARKVVLKDDIKWDHFADGFPKLFIENVKDLAGRDGLFNLSIQFPVVFLSFGLNLI